MSGLHAILAPSSAHLRVACSASRAMCERNPETEPSPESMEGTAAHWAAAEMFAGRIVDSGLIAPNGVMITDEMLEGAEMFVDDVHELFGNTPIPLHIEEPVSCATIHPESWGTPDLWIFDGAKLYLWDFKFGHRFVDVFENWQLIEYVAGILESLGINGMMDQHIEVVFRIVQPRCYVGGAPIREWRIMASDLRPYFNQLRSAEQLAMQPDAPATVNEHCRDCRGAHECDALQRAGYAAMVEATRPVPFSLPPHALGAELRYLDRAIKVLDARRTALAEQALTALKRGERVPFYAAKPSVGRERWTVPPDQVISMGQLMGVDVAKPGTLTPKQAIKAGLDASVVKAISEIPSGEIKLVEDDGTEARKVFAK